MARINITQLRKQERRAQKRYERYGQRVIYSALVKTIDLNNPYQQLDPMPMQEGIEKVYMYVGLDSAKREYERLRKEEPTKAIPDFFLNTWSRWIRDYVRVNLGQMIVDITANTRDKINRALQEGIEAGETRTDIAR